MAKILKPVFNGRAGERLLALVNNPPEGMHWRCVRCGVPHVSAPPADSICFDCHRPERTRTRASFLTDADAPERHRAGFSEPGSGGLQAAWPADRNGVSCLSWLGGAQGWSLLLVGEPGVGKSAIAAELLYREMRDRRRSGGWLRASLIARYTLSSKAHEIAWATEAGVLVMDDLGRGHEADAAWGCVAEVACARWDGNLPTIFTSNMTLKEIVARNAALADRLRDGMVCRVTGESLRGGA